VRDADLEEMSGRRVIFTLCVAVSQACALSAAGATPTSGSVPSTTTTTATTTTTIKPDPPPAFALPADFGLQLMQAQAKAKVDLVTAQAKLGPARQAAQRAKREDVLARRELKRLTARARATARQLDATRQHLRVAAAEAYINADAAGLAAAISTFTDANSVVDVASKLHMISTYDSNQRDALQEYLDLKARVDRQVSEISDLRDRTSGQLLAATQGLNDVKHAIDDAAHRIADTLVGMTKFEAAATSASSPILGPSRLSANQMAAFVKAEKYKPRITAPLRDLAQMYLDEGTRTGVRGDVAFAQSILETAGFRNPGSAATDNNFAGIGWCDSCAHGYNFPDAQTGVRAQLQLLRTYVDPSFPQPEYTDPILLPGTLMLGFRGKVQTWWDLWGTWATGALYGQRVYDLYQRMVTFAEGVPALPPEPIKVPPPSSGAPGEITRPPASGPGTKKP
jgi:hypothetical protein